MAGREFLKRQVAEAAASGHALNIEHYFTRSGAKFEAMCSCGYKSAPRRSEGLALGAAIHHIGQAAATTRSNGAPDTRRIGESPPSVRPRL